MDKKFVMGIVLLIFLGIVIGCSKDVQEDKRDEKSPQQDMEESQKEKDPIQEKIQEMTVEEKVGQMVMVGLEGHSLDEHVQEMIENHYVGGFILFSKNIENPQQLVNLTDDLKNANGKNSIPLFLSIDEEGGRVSRMPPEFKKLPPNGAIGKKNDPMLSHEIGRTIAKQIKSLGFNMDFAPVLDINSNPNNPVIGDRSFSSDEKIVSELGIQTMKGIQSENILSVVKHFPGHGDTDVDSHLGLPLVNKDIDELMELELLPFKKAIDNGADTVMVAHILYDKIDPQYPATLSRPIIQGILREQLGFNGLIITDDMTMGAIMENYDIGEAAIQSVKAGSDIVLVCHEYENEVKVLNALKNAVENGEISEDRIDQSLYRILKIKKDYGLADEKIGDADIDKINEDIGKVLKSF